MKKILALLWLSLLASAALTILLQSEVMRTGIIMLAALIVAGIILMILLYITMRAIETLIKE